MPAYTSLHGNSNALAPTFSGRRVCRKQQLPQALFSQQSHRRCGFGAMSDSQALETGRMWEAAEGSEEEPGGKTEPAKDQGQLYEMTNHFMAKDANSVSSLGPRTGETSVVYAGWRRRLG